MSIVLGLTGGIASGKSTVSRLFAQLGASIVDADVAARAVVAPGSVGLRQIVQQFGPEVLLPDGSLDRHAMGQIVFTDADQRRKLEQIVHPLVCAWMTNKMAELRNADVSLIVLDIPLLFESGVGLTLCGKTAVVWVPKEVQLVRLMQRDHLTKVEAQQRIDAQMPLDHKRKLADYCIDNSGALSCTEDQVKHIWLQLVKARRSGDA